VDTVLLEPTKFPQRPNPAEAFVLANVVRDVDPPVLSFVIIGQDEKTVADFLTHAIPSIAANPLKDALFEMSERLGRCAAPSDPTLATEALPPLGGCCSCSTGVSVLVVHPDPQSGEFRQALLLNKTVKCTIEGPHEQLIESEQKTTAMFIQDGSVRCPESAPTAGSGESSAA